MEKKHDHLKFEKEIQSFWEKEKIHKFDPKSSKKIFSIDTPPPTVSGNLHIGHIFSYTQTDIIARYKRMQNHNIFYPMGFDDNGLPTERYVEKKHKIKALLMKRSEFIELCLKESNLAEKEFEKIWRSLGLSIDWNLTYSTISKKVRKISQYSFLELYKKNLVYRKEEPSLYCTTCRTSVAQAELNNIEISTTFNNVEFESKTSEKLIISTTRPELLPACVAILYHPKDKRYGHLKNKIATTPIFGNKIKIIPDINVDMEKGTGLVMCCTFGDQMDIVWQKKHKLPFIQIVGFDGVWTKNAGPLAGLRIHEARKKALELLKEAGKLKKQQSIIHTVNVHERCKQGIEYLILKQWFIKILDYKTKFLKAAEKINWYPTFIKSRYIDWVENLGWDWCISRQRFYGIPFPVWHCQDCNQILLAEFKDLPIDPQEYPYPNKKCSQCQSKNIKPDTDIMDTWATSSLTPHININWPDKSSNKISFPMSLRPQAHDIIRTWAFYTIVKTHYHNNTIPWEEIAISGYVTTEGREKISKSKEDDRYSPKTLMQQYPTDAIRYWAANGKLGFDTALSETQFKIGSRLITKLWNAFRFCKEHITGYKKRKTKLKHTELNQWLLHKFNETLQNYIKYFEAYEYHHALSTAESFFWTNFCDNYLEIIKDQFFNPEKYSNETIESTRTTLYEVGFGLLQLFAPILPYITETLYQTLFKNNEGSISLHITNLDIKRYDYKFKENTKLIDTVINIVGKVRKLKSATALSLKTELEEVNIYSTNTKLLNSIKTQEKIISGVTKTKKINFINKELKEASLTKENELWFAKISLSLSQKLKTL